MSLGIYDSKCYTTDVDYLMQHFTKDEAESFIRGITGSTMICETLEYQEEQCETK